MFITAITPQKRNQKRLNIFLDGKYAFSLTPEQVITSGLQVNQELTQKEVDQLIKDSEFSKWLNLVLRLLSFRPRSAKEVVDYLNRKEVGETTVRSVLEHLQEKGLIDDVAFAKWFVEQRLAFRPKAKRLLSLELKQKGVRKDIIDQVIDSNINKESEVEIALKLIQKKDYLWEKLEDLKRKKKIQDYLGRRGFDWEVISKVIKQVDSSRHLT